MMTKKEEEKIISWLVGHNIRDCHRHWHCHRPRPHHRHRHRHRHRRHHHRHHRHEKIKPWLAGHYTRDWLIALSCSLLGSRACLPPHNSSHGDLIIVINIGINIVIIIIIIINIGIIIVINIGINIGINIVITNSIIIALSCSLLGLLTTQVMMMRISTSN